MTKTRALLFFAALMAAVAGTMGGAWAAEPVARVVFLVGEQEYGTQDTLPEFAKNDLEPLGIESVFLFAEGDKEPQRNRFPSFEALDDADVLFISVRRRALKNEQLDRIRQWVEAGKPVIGVRTATHAFELRSPDTPPEGHGVWSDFDVEVLGADYQGHYSNQGGKGSAGATLLRVTGDGKDRAIMAGVKISDGMAVRGSLYKSRDISTRALVLIEGYLEKDESAVEPVAWIYTNEHGGRVFYTSLGGVSDMQEPAIRQLLTNAVFWSLNLTGPKIDDARNKEKIAKEPPLSALDALKHIWKPDDLAIDLIAEEPLVEQPVFLNFDERGRMWVVQYRQYPYPAGLKLVSRDKHWRNVYDKTPGPPGSPEHIRGLDKITIHEDTNGDGRFDKVKLFADGLNIVTSLVRGRGGVWVLNPPYLLFYPDEDNDDVPDGDPEVHIRGFGLEDTHAVVNSLRWGPDGWLYGGQGSTVSARAEVLGSEAPPVLSRGQLMWRYHPDKRVYEIFAEGGGNLFSCEFDSKGRLFGGTNTGHRGFHYVQGAYYRKNFGKHGELSNPYAFGYFGGLHETTPRLTNTIMIYEGGDLPQRYAGRLLAANPLLGHVPISALVPKGSTFEGASEDFLIKSDHRWFRPVDIKGGPDGAVYIADWYDRQINHYRNHEGQISPKDGRIIRVRGKTSGPIAPFDLNQSSADELVDLLLHQNRWFRQTALRLIGQRQDDSILPRLRQMLRDETGQAALEAFWALNLLGDLGEKARLSAMSHANPHVRRWAVRLIGDERQASEAESGRMLAMARTDPDVEVRSQLASAAMRLPAASALPIVSALLRRGEDADDPHLPLMAWWAMESKCADDADRVLALFDDPELWQAEIVRSDILERLMRRLASTGRQDDLRLCARLFEMAPGPEAVRPLIAGFENAYQGRAIAGLPGELSAQLAKHAGDSLTLQLRAGEPGALEKSLAAIGNPRAPAKQRRALIKVFGEMRHDSAVAPLLAVLGEDDESLVVAALSSLQAYSHPEIGEGVAGRIPRLAKKPLRIALSLLGSRPGWAMTLAEAVRSGAIDAGLVGDDFVSDMRRLDSPELRSVIESVWGPAESVTDEELELEILRVRHVVSTGRNGDPYKGRELFLERCSVCHTLYNEGGQIGPELTSYQRQDLDSVLLSVINPSAEIREGFENLTVETKDGRTIYGFLTDQDSRTVTVRPLGGQDVVLRRDEIASLEPAEISLMPSGLVSDLSDPLLSDLFTYIRTTQPLNIKK